MHCMPPRAADGTNNTRRPKQQSPLIIAGIVSLVVTVGGLLLSEAGEVIQAAVSKAP